MARKISGAILCIATFAMSAMAQTVTTSGATGSVGNIPYVSATSSTSITLAASPIAVSGNSVGVGTASPQTTLQLVQGGNGFGDGGSIGIGANSGAPPMFTIRGTLFTNGSSGDSGDVLFNVRPSGTSPLVTAMTLLHSGDVGIGTNSPQTTLHAVQGGNVAGAGGSIGLGANSGEPPMFTIQSSLYTNGASGDSGDVLFNVRPSGTSPLSTSMTLLHGGGVGIGTEAPGAKLEVNGNIKLTAGSGASMTYQDGSVQTVAWNGVLSGGDYAESVDVGGDRGQYEPGDVLVIDHDAQGRFLKSSMPYSTTVMGVYSTRPGVIGRRQQSDKSHMKEEVPMAMVGVVPTKVCSEGGAISPGDLLVTSSRPGYAMKGTDRAQLTGAIIGKALGRLDNEIGVIEVAVSLQ